MLTAKHSYVLGRVTPRGAAAENAAAQERALQGVVPVQAASAKSGDLTGRVETRDGLPVLTQRPRIQVGLNPAQGFTGQGVEFDADERPSGRVEDPVGRSGPAETVAQITARVVDALNLRVF